MEESSVERKRRLGRMRTQKWRKSMSPENVFKTQQRRQELAQLKKLLETPEEALARRDVTNLSKRLRRQSRVQNAVPEIEFVRQMKRFGDSELMRNSGENDVIDPLTADDITFETVYCGFFYPGIPEEEP